MFEKSLGWLARHGLTTRVIMEMSEYVDDAVMERDEAVESALHHKGEMEYWMERTGERNQLLHSQHEFLSLCLSLPRLAHAMDYFYRSVVSEPDRKVLRFRVEPKYTMTAEDESRLLSEHPAQTLEEIVGWGSLDLDFMWVRTEHYGQGAEPYQDGTRYLLIEPSSLAILKEAVRARRRTDAP